MKYVQRQDSFYSNYFKRTRKSAITYNVSGKNILLSGDVELNPGPVLFDDVLTVQGISFEAPDFTFQCRLLRYRLRPLDVGGGGDCYFKSISHQLYRDPSHHLQIREAGVQYLMENPERFIESNVEASWFRYLSSMSRKGTWADHIIIQAVAEVMNLKIHIIESDNNFRDMTLVEPSNSTIQNARSVYIGHIGQMHYVSTCSALCERNSNQINNGKTNELSESLKNDAGSGCIINTKECPERIIARNNIDVEKSCNNNICRRKNKQPKNSEINHCKKRKQEKAAYMRQYRSAKASPEKSQA